MAPPLIFLLFAILLVALIAAGAFIALRTGLWVRETSSSAEQEVHDPAMASGRRERDDERFERPEHVRVEDPAKQRYIGT